MFNLSNVIKICLKKFETIVQMHSYKNVMYFFMNNFADILKLF